ncbi:MAG: inositol monophosphatase family protein [Cardiobacteriaceae bacterium]|nr:inositol monophosphatase family protein [Cardiobacteriaceae bacterium]
MLPLPPEFAAFAEQLADEARRITLAHFRKPLAHEWKADASPVTLADRETERHLRALIRARYPEHAILGEEEGASGDSPWRWIIDPIDGTRSFMAGHPIYAVLIALCYEGIPLVNIIDMPALGERFAATHDTQTTFNGNAVHTRDVPLADALLYSSSPDMFNAAQFARREALARHCAQSRYGGDAYLYAMLAAGWIDLVIEADMKAHDFMPLVLIVEQAGGIISDWQGNPLHPDSSGEILAAATPSLHAQALALLNA